MDKIKGKIFKFTSSTTDMYTLNCHGKQNWLSLLRAHSGQILKNSAFVLEIMLKVEQFSRNKIIKQCKIL